MSRVQALAEAGHPLSRRSFLVAAAGAALAFGFGGAARAAMDPEVAGNTPEPVAPPEFAPGLWFSIDSEGTVRINIIRAEMGQHVGTALARILAEELEADWDKVRVIYVDSDPKWGFMVTGGSWSVWQTFPVFSRAGAAGRTALIESGARLLGVSPAVCTARNGKVMAGSRSVSYGDIAARGGPARQFTAEEIDAMPIKPVAERRLIGKPTQALDISRKVDGTGLYGIDAKVPGMVYARPRLPPTRNGSRVVSVNDAEAKHVKGYLQYLVVQDPSDTVPGWVLAIAESFPAAIRASKLLDIQWTAGPGADVSEQQLQEHALDLVSTGKGGVDLDVGSEDPAPLFAAGAKTLEQVYTTSTVLHFQLEPLNALALEKDGVMEIHTGNQWQSLILPTLAKALGRPETGIVLRSYLLGGGFGRRLNGDYTVPAALAAKALGKPVKLVMLREDDVQFDSVRSPSVQRVRMAFGDGGSVDAMEHYACAGWPTKVMAGALLSKGQNDGRYDPFAISGADHWYDVGRQRVCAISSELANTSFRPGWLRSVGPGWTNWALESFMDEAARHLGEDPVAFRLRLLNGKGRNAGSRPNAVGGALRQAAVVRQAAERAGWGGELPKDTGLGIATSFGQERDMPTWGACVARVRVDRLSGVVTVEKLTIVMDAGTIVDPDGALAQTQGAALWGLSMALHEGTAFENGQMRDSNLNTYTPLRIHATPPFDISFVQSAEVPVGLGEPATTIVAPAIGNAIFAAVGARLRHLPIRAESVLAALKA